MISEKVKLFLTVTAEAYEQRPETETNIKICFYKCVSRGRQKPENQPKPEAAGQSLTRLLFPNLSSGDVFRCFKVLCGGGQTDKFSQLVFSLWTEQQLLLEGNEPD